MKIYVNAIEPLWIQTAIMVMMMQSTMILRSGGEFKQVKAKFHFPFSFSCIKQTSKLGRPRTTKRAMMNVLSAGKCFLM